MSYYISNKICPQSHRCPLIAKCPVNAISQNGFDVPIIDEEQCIGCGACQQVCPLGAVQEK